ncbi:MAG: hypothetical protein HY075_02735 [Deltaproteobacteria bacterium]|nr:hypothetical protein [Deltaproteobacteria bacterium]
MLALGAAGCDLNSKIDVPTDYTMRLEGDLQTGSSQSDGKGGGRGGKDSFPPPFHGMDLSGNSVSYEADPHGFDGSTSGAYPCDGTRHADVEVERVMAPIRDVLMYRPWSVNERAWRELTAPLDDLNIRTVSVKIGAPAFWRLSSEDVLAYSRSYLGRQSVRPIADYLLDAELSLKCYLYDEAGLPVDFGGAEGAEYCRDKMGLELD